MSLLSVGAVGSAIAASTCCVGPPLLALLVVSMAGAAATFLWAPVAYLGIALLLLASILDLLTARPRSTKGS